jgi:hypothetical protein
MRGEDALTADGLPGLVSDSDRKPSAGLFGE